MSVVGAGHQPDLLCRCGSASGEWSGTAEYASPAGRAAHSIETSSITKQRSVTRTTRQECRLPAVYIVSTGLHVLSLSD